jgi:hypothetical protein
VTGHIVTLVLDGAISRVECKACGSIHKYRETPKQQIARKKQPAVRHVRVGQERREGRIVTTEVRQDTTAIPTAPERGRGGGKRENAWREAMRRHDGEPAHPYSMHNAFQPHTLLHHPLFGQGEILDVTRPDKMRVLFQEGIKILRCKLT